MSEPVRRRRTARYADAAQPAELTQPARTEENATATPPVPEPPMSGQILPEQPVHPADDAPIPAPREVLATNTGVRLACTMAAMMGLFALFLCWAEQESRVIRCFSVQSAFLTVAHAALGLGALLISTVLGGIPFLGLMVTLLCLLTYIAGLILLLITRIRLMQHAWQGVRFTLPLPLERIIRRYY